MISERGPRKSGPTAYARTKMERMRDCSTELVMLSWAAMAGRAGATMEEETGEMKVKEETISVAAHFLPLVQFLGFSGSSGPSQVTCSASVQRNSMWDYIERTKLGSLADLELFIRSIFDGRDSSSRSWRLRMPPRTSSSSWGSSSWSSPS